MEERRARRQLETTEAMDSGEVARSRATGSENDPPAERSIRDGSTWLALANAAGEDVDAHASLGPDSVETGEVLGQGGMGLVRRGYERRLAREVAVKEMLATRTRSPEARFAFIAEARITGHLDHPHIVPIHALQAAGSDIRILMKLVRGDRWVDVLRRDHGRKDEPFPLHAHLQVLLSVCNAMAFAHERGIVHRDLKPGNVMVGRFGEVWLMDWGLALAVDDAVARHLRIPHRRDIRGPEGTPSYMAPEMAAAEGAPISRRTDVFLLGATLYHVLAGHPPYPGPDRMQALADARKGRRKPLPADVPTELAHLCERAMELDPEHRYHSVLQFKEGLEAYLQHAQSTLLATSAAKRLDTLARNERRGRAPDRALRYADLFDAIGGFKRALDLWPRNAQAQAGLARARDALARSALAARDFELARTQLTGEVPQQDAELRCAIEDKEARTRRRIRAAASLRWGLLGVAAAGLVLLLGAALSFQVLERTSRTEGERVAELFHTQVVDALDRAVAGSAQLMQERRRAVELVAAQYAREVAQALDRVPPETAVEPLLSNALTPGGPLAYEAPSFFFPASAQAEAEAVIRRLSRTAEATRALYQRHASLAVRYFAGVAEGHVLLLYPGAGGVSPDYDPVRRPWYVQALKTGGLVHTPPYTDHTTHEIVVSTVLPVTSAEGEVLGVAGVDTTLEARLATTALPAELERHTDVLVAGPHASDPDRLRVLARHTYTARGAPEDLWHFDVSLDDVPLPSGSAGRRMRGDLASGRHGVVETPWMGERGVLAYAPIAGSDLLLLMFVDDEYVSQPSEAIRERLRARLNESLRATGSWMLYSLAGLVLLSLALAGISWLRRRSPR